MNGDLRVGTWLVQPSLNAISQNRTTRRLEPKVMEVLVCLAHHSGETLPKEYLLKTVWPDTFISDDVLVRCISEIRRAFEDDPREPKFIQTIPKRGYRLVVTVERIDGVANVAAETALIAPHDSFGLDRNAEPAHWPYVVFGLLVITVLMLFVALRPKPPAQLVSVPFTLLPGMEISPSFSPDGKQISFLWNGGLGKNYDLYTKQLSSEKLRRLTTTGDLHSRAAWSHDGKSIAFLRLSGNVVSLAVLPSSGGTEETLLSGAFPAALSSSVWLDDLEWSPQGNALLLVWRPTPGQPSAIFRFSLGDRSLVQLTNPPLSSLGDFAPRFAPDGQTIQFLRVNGYNAADLYVMKADGQKLHRIDLDLRPGDPGVGSWEPDGRHLLVNVSDGSGFLRIPMEGGTPQRLSGFGQLSQLGAVSPDGHLLTFASCWVDSNLWMAKLNFGRKSIETMPLYSSARAESPAFSPDGRQIAFASKASGEWEIWTCDSNCLKPVQLTSRNSPATGSPAWSPDGRQVVFESEAGRFQGIYVMNADGSGIRLLQGGDFDNDVPQFSADGRWIYFSSNRHGTWEVWKMSASGENAAQITRHGGYQAVESRDKRFVFFAKVDAPGLWSLPVGGGEEQLLTTRLRKGYWSHWTIGGDSAFFIDAESKPKPNLVKLDLSTRQSREIGAPEGIRDWSWGLAISPDGSSLVGTAISDQQCNIMLGKNYSDVTRQ